MGLSGNFQLMVRASCWNFLHANGKKLKNGFKTLISRYSFAGCYLDSLKIHEDLAGRELEWAQATQQKLGQELNVKLRMEGGSTNRDFQHRIRLLLKWPDVFLPEKWWMIDWSFSYTLAVLPFDQIISKFAQLDKIVTCPVRSTSLPRHTSSTFPHTILFDETWFGNSNSYWRVPRGLEIPKGYPPQQGIIQKSQEIAQILILC